MSQLPPPRPTKDHLFLKIAAVFSTRSQDPSTHVGAVIVSPEDGALLSSGYNGFPFGVANHPERYSDRAVKMRFTAHAEANAICLAARKGTRLQGAHMYVTATPCCECARAIIQAGIKKVYLPNICPFGNPPDMQESFSATFDLFSEAGVEVFRLSSLIGVEIFARGKLVQI